MHDMALALEHVWVMILNHWLSGAISRLLGSSQSHSDYRMLCCKCRPCHVVHKTLTCRDVHLLSCAGYWSTLEGCTRAAGDGAAANASHDRCHTGCRTNISTDVVSCGAAAGCWTTTASCSCRSCRRPCGRTRTSCSLPRRTPLARTVAARYVP